ncbi:MAG: branched-chain amino acid ABC transporter permease [Methanoregulaceae archaeon]|jgi:branched-chain amino acid transport system permease protein|nr:branched-chain amino acid ABC transporter permease [Methanoregulaceae archaeon]
MTGGLDIVLQVGIWGLYAGCIYILLAIGLNLIFGVMKVVNFAHGEFLMLGAYVTFTFYAISGFNPYVLLVASVPILILIGVTIERLCFRPILGTGKLNEIFISIGLIYLIQNAAAVIWTDEYRIIHSPFESITISVFGVNLPLDYLIIIITTILILIGLYLFLRKTRLGKAMRATSQNRKGAMLMGINVEKMDMISFGIGAGLAGAAGTLWVVSGQVFTPYMGSIPAVKAFAIIIIGGLGSIPGAIVGGIILGLAENFAIFTIGGAWKDAISFLILIVVLIFKPTGLFGESAE